MEAARQAPRAAIQKRRRGQSSGTGSGSHGRPKKATPVLSLALVNYNSGYRLRQCLEAIGRHPPTCPYEVIVVDNASRDGSADFLREAALPNVRAIFSPINLLFTGGVNLAHAEASGEFFMILNPDLIALEGSFDALVRHLQHDATIGAIGGYTLTKGLVFERYINSFPTPAGVALTHFGKGLAWTRSRAAYRRYHMDGEDFDLPREAPQPAGGCFIIRASLFEGRLLDPGFGIFWSDVELARKAWRSGSRIMVFPDARFIHDHDATPRTPNRRNLLINLDFFVGSSLYFRLYEGAWPAFRLKLLLAAGLVASAFLIRLPMILVGKERPAVWWARVRVLGWYLAGRNQLLLEAREAAERSPEPRYSQVLTP
ncbi:MAG: glycosyltransferase family 2 protein [Thermoplasmatota archaeon]